jgi:hypothetical protein
LQLSQKYERWCGWSNFDEDGNIIETETIERVKPVLEVLEDEVSEEDDDEDETEEDETWCGRQDDEDESKNRNPRIIIKQK